MYVDGRAWRLGPHVVYRRLAATVLDVLDHPVTALAAVDAGAGTGAMGEELAARGARVVYTDRAYAMVHEAPRPRFVADITALGLRDRCVDLAAANAVLSHVDEPDVAVAELARVTRGLVLATGLAAGVHHPVKAAVDGVLASFGYEPPAWYLRLKSTGEARVGEPAALAAVGAEGGLDNVRVLDLGVPLTGLDVDTVVAWRLGMAQVAPFCARLPAARLGELTARARAAVVQAGLEQPVRVLALVGEVT